MGPKYNNETIENKLKDLRGVFKKFSDPDLIKEVAAQLNNQKTIGWFQGRMEFGPLALGGRSILADPSSEKMQKVLNLKVKFRESFRPFCPFSSKRGS